VADNQLSLAFIIESGEAVAGVEQVNTALDGTKSAATAATGAAKDTGVALSGSAAAAGPALGEVNAELADIFSGATAAADAAKKIGPAVQTIPPAVDATTAAFDKMGQSQGIRGLTRSIVDAKMAMEDFKASAAASGTDVTAKLGQMQAAIDASTQKLGLYKKAMADTASTGAMMGSQLDALRTKAGSLTGMFDSMERTGTGLTKMVGEMGLGIGIAGIAFMGAEMAGKKLAAAIDWVASKHLALIDAENKGRAAADSHAAAMRALDAGLIANSDSTAGLIHNYELFIIASGRGSEAAKKAAADFAGVGAAMDSLATKTQKAETISVLLEGAFKRSGAEGLNMSISMESALRKIETEYRALGDAVPAGIRKALDALDSLKTKNTVLAASVVELNKKMADLPAAMQKSIDAETKLAASAKFVSDAHDKLVPELVKILETLHEDTIAWGDSTAAHEKATAALAAYAAAYKLTVAQVMKMVAEQGDLSSSLEKTDAAFAAQIGNLDTVASKMGTFAERTRDAALALKEMNAEADRQTAAIQKRNAEIDAAITETQNFAAAQREGIAVQGQATVVSITLASATKEATAALVEMLKAQNSYTDSLQKTLSIATGWSDYLANLVDAYQSGMTSILQYKLALENFLHTLETQFATATGKAKAALEEMIATVQKLINTAGAGPAPSTDFSAGGMLNKQFNKP
jgi:hypothetical protein